MVWIQRWMIWVLSMTIWLLLSPPSTGGVCSPMVGISMSSAMESESESDGDGDVDVDGGGGVFTVGIKDARHNGHVILVVNQLSMHSTWKVWPHGGILFRRSSDL